MSLKFFFKTAEKSCFFIDFWPITKNYYKIAHQRAFYKDYLVYEKIMRNPSKSLKSISTTDNDMWQSINAIKSNDGSGGFDQRQVQLALTDLFSSHSEVYIPDIEALTESLPLSELKNQGYRYVGFSLAANRVHQVAIWIELNDNGFLVKLFDSKKDEQKSEENANDAGLLLNRQMQYHLQFIMSEAENNYTLYNEVSPYAAQEDDWSCGIYVIAHLLYAYSGGMVRRNSKILDLDSLLIEYYFAFKRQEKLLLDKYTYTIERKKNLLQKISVYSDEEVRKIFFPLADFIHSEILEDQAIMEKMHRLRSLQLACARYFEKYPGDNINSIILKVFTFYIDAVENRFDVAIDNVLRLASLRNNSLCMKPRELDLLVTELNMVVSDKENKREFLIFLLDTLLMADDDKTRLKNFLKENDNSEYLARFENNEDLPQLIFELLKTLLEQIDKLLEYTSWEQVRLKKEEEVRGAAKKNKVKNVKRIFDNLGLAQFEEELYQNLANDRCILFIKKYIDVDFFKNCTVEKIKQVFCSLVKSNATCNIQLALKLYPQNDHLRLAIKHEDEIIDAIHLKEIIPYIPLEDEKFLFVKRHADKIMAGNEIAEIYQQLEANQDAFLNDQSEKIRTGWDVSEIVAVMSDNKKWPFVMQHINKINGNNNIVRIYRQLPVSYQILFRDKVRKTLPNNTDMYHIADVLDMFIIEERLSLVRECENNIKSPDIIALIYPKLSEADHKIFLGEQKNTIHNALGVSIVLAVLQKEKLSFVDQHAEKITNGWEMARIYEKLDEAEAEIFLAKYQYIINNGIDVADMLEVIKSDKYEFIGIHEDKITAGWDVIKIYSQLFPSVKRDEFLEKHKSKLENADEIINILSIMELDGLKRISFTEAMQDKIKPERVIGVLEKIPIYVRLDFLKIVLKKIESDQIKIIVNLLWQGDQLPFVRLLRNKISKGSICDVMQAISDRRDKLIFLKEQKNKITNSWQMARIYNALFEEDKRSFLDEFGDIIRNENDLVTLLQELPEAEKLAFARKHQDKIWYINKEKVLKCLPEKDQKIFDDELYENMTGRVIKSSIYAGAAFFGIACSVRFTDKSSVNLGSLVKNILGNR